MDWIKPYSDYLAYKCAPIAREKAFADLDAQKFKCNSYPYHLAECLFDAVNEIYEAYQNCQKLKMFKKNDE